MSLIAQARISDNVVANAGFAGGFHYGGYGTRAAVTFAWLWIPSPLAARGPGMTTKRLARLDRNSL
jgi:hypothetical protein